MRTRYAFPLIVLLVLQLTAHAHSDEITLANGDRISGEILSISDNKVRLATDYAGEISVDFTKVADLKTDKPGSIALKNGDVVTGTIDSVSGGQISISSQALGVVRIPLSLFDGLNKTPSEAELAEIQRTRKLLEQKEKEIEELTSVSKLWSGSFATGVQLMRGNTDTTNVRVDVTATRKAPREELRLRFYSDYGQAEGETNANEVFGEAKLKVFQTPRFYLFGVTNMEYDEMEDLDLRAQVFGGPGLLFIDNKRTHLLGEIGAGLTGEFYDDDGDKEELEASMWLNAEWKQKLFENVEFFQGLTIFPSLSEAGDFRLRSESSIKSPLAKNWALKFSLIDQYDSDPEGEDVLKNDLQLISSVEYTF